MHNESIHASDSEKTSSRFILDSLRQIGHREPKSSPALSTAVEAKADKDLPKDAPQKAPPKEAPRKAPPRQDPDEVPPLEAPRKTAPSPTSRAQAADVKEESPRGSHRPLPWTPPLLPAEKKYFRASEVGQLLSVEAHVLRYWQKEFPLIRPAKHGGTHWVYSRKDVETLHLVQHLLYREGLSIREAKKEIRERIKTLKEQVQHPAPLKGGVVPANPESLKALVKEIKELIHMARNTPTF